MNNEEENRLLFNKLLKKIYFMVIAILELLFINIIYPDYKRVN